MFKLLCVTFYQHISYVYVNHTEHTYEYMGIFKVLREPVFLTEQVLPAQ